MRTLLAPIIAAFLLVACNKKEQITSSINQENLLANSKEITVTEDGILSFSSRDAFDETVSRLATFNSAELKKWQQTLGFNGFLSQDNTSLISVEKDPANYNTSVTDSVFLSLLDKWGIVEIEGYYFKAEIDNGLVWAIGRNGGDSLKTYLAQLRARTFNPSVMNRFNLAEEDAFEKLDSGYVGIDQPPVPVIEGLFGNDDKKNDDVGGPGSAVWRADCKASYQAAVFYFSLMSEMKYMSGLGSSPTFWQPRSTEIFYATPTQCKFKPKNRPEQFPSVPGGVTDNKLNWRPYTGSRRLDKYLMDANFAYLTQNTIPQYTRFVRVRVVKGY